MPHATFLNLPEEKQERITAAALQEFAEKGYHQGSIHAITLRAGVAKGSMYQYFAGKKELFFYIFNLAVQDKIRFVRNLLEENRGLPFFEQLEKLFVASQAYAREHPATYQLYMNIRKDVPTEIRQELLEQLEFTGTRKHYTSLIREAVRKGEIRGDVDAEFAVFVVRTLLQEFASRLVDNQNISAAENKQQVCQFINFLKNGLQGEMTDD
jgi:TetR/AcrR family transcriptional regulator